MEQSICNQWYNGAYHFQIKSSGSTGKPKTISFSRDQIIFSANATKRFLNLPDKGIGYVALPTQYTGGFMSLMRCLVYEYDIEIAKPETAFKNLHKKYTITSVTPHQVYKLMEQNRLDLLDKFDFILVGGSPLSGELEHHLQNVKSSIFQTFGMTETLSHIALRQIAPNREKYFNVLPDYHVESEPDGRLVIMAELFGPKPIITNDIVEFHGNNQFEWLGRSDNVINTGGIKIHPEMLETNIKKILNVEELLIKGESDNKFGTVVVLIILKNTPHSDDYIYKKLRSSLKKQEVPKIIRRVDKFLRTNTGKLKRN